MQTTSQRERSDDGGERAAAATVPCAGHEGHAAARGELTELGGAQRSSKPASQQQASKQASRQASVKLCQHARDNKLSRRQEAWRCTARHATPTVLPMEERPKKKPHMLPVPWPVTVLLHNPPRLSLLIRASLASSQPAIPQSDALQR